jgi:hypothetical protein
MTSPRRLTLAVIIFGALVAASIAVTTKSTAQKKPAEKQSPEPEKKELLTVQPAPAQTPPNADQQKPSTRIQLPEGGVDDKTPIITNTDLITFNVTVTDIYGRFVSGLKTLPFPSGYCSMCRDR